MSNPPYSVGQKSANDNAQNQSYPKLEARIAETYAASSNATNKNSLYDSYIKAFRWSTDRLEGENGGVISFVSNGAWLDGNAQAGFRTYLEKEFSSVYVFNLRGNQRTSGELSRREGGKIFGSGSRTPISITLLIKKPRREVERAVIHYYDIGDYLSREEKLEIIQNFATVSAIPWKILSPNEHGDWISQRNDVFSTFIPIEPEEKFYIHAKSFFVVNSRGLETTRDAWSYNSSRKILVKNMKSHVEYFNLQIKEFKKYLEKNNITKFDDVIIDNFLDKTASKISWSSSLISKVKQFQTAKFEEDKISEALYRPFHKQYFYYGELMVHRRGQFEDFFPTHSTDNKVICVTGIGTNKDFSVIITDVLPDIQLQSNGQCFPLYWFEKKKQDQDSLFEKTEDEYTRHDAVSDFILEQAQSRYGHRVEKEDIFYYAYGLLHSPEYRKTFANDLKKMLPHLPLVEKPADFWSFSKAGRELAELHLNYEELKPPKEVKVTGTDKGNFIINKMSFPAKGQKNTIIYNAHITISNIPAKAYEYIVNGKSAIEWVMERYAITTHKESGIKNDPNDWAKEHGNSRYILDLLLSVITVSVKTVEIVAGLPKVAWT
jgi:predicted helicase